MESGIWNQPVGWVSVVLDAQPTAKMVGCASRTTLTHPTSNWNRESASSRFRNPGRPPVSPPPAHAGFGRHPPQHDLPDLGRAVVADRVLRAHALADVQGQPPLAE